MCVSEGGDWVRSNGDGVSEGGDWVRSNSDGMNARSDSNPCGIYRVQLAQLLHHG